MPPPTPSIWPPGRVAGVALVAPTWRGPLPTVAGGHRPWQAGVRAAIEAPGLLAAKTAVTRRRRGARFATAAFVTGGLDLVRSREEVLSLAQRAGAPILALWGPQVARRSGAEMAALAGLSGMRAARLPAGALGVHEEHPAEVAAALRPFLIAL